MRELIICSSVNRQWLWTLEPASTAKAPENECSWISVVPDRQNRT
jgi:hypothetical protein